MTDFGSIWKTIREVDILAIRHEAEHDVIVACVGDPAALEHVRGLLLDGPDRYGQPLTALALVGFDQVGERERLIGQADLLIVALDAGATLSAADVAGLDRLAALRPQSRILVTFGERSRDAGLRLDRLDRRHTRSSIRGAPTPRGSSPRRSSPRCRPSSTCPPRGGFPACVPPSRGA